MTWLRDLRLTSEELDYLELSLRSATDADLDAIQELLTGRRVETPATPADLGRIVYGDQWQSPPHIELLNRELVRASIVPRSRLLVTMPPRHGKSVMCSEIFPAWYAGHNPDNRLMLGSYSSDLASEFGMKARNILEEHGPRLFGVSVDPRSSASERWGIEKRRGGMQARGYRSGFNGKGANLFIVDDVVKDAETANSPTIRARIWDWWQSTAYTRLEPDGSIVVIQTRWHDDDHAGRLIKQSKENWRRIDFPAIAVENDILGRKPGEALWPERFSAEILGQVREEVGAYVWACLFQQRPLEGRGTLFKRDWLRYHTMQGTTARLWAADGKLVKVLEAHEYERFITVDCAGSSDELDKARAGKRASDSVISVWDYDRRDGNLLWKSCQFGKWPFNELVQKVRASIVEWSPAWCGIEDEKTGRAVLTLLRNFPVRGLSHEGKDKVSRAATLLAMLERGKVFISQEAPWRQHVESELTSWDGGQDSPFDCGDTAAYAARYAWRSDKKTTVASSVFGISGSIF